MNKTAVWIVCIIVFVFVTTFVLSLDVSTTSRRVKITNQNFAINHENTELVNDENVKFNIGKTNIDNKQIDTKNQAGIKSTDVNLANSGGIENQDTGFEDESAYARQQTNFDNAGNYDSQKIDFKNLDDSDLDNVIANAQNNQGTHTKLNSEPVKFQQQDEYMYKDLDWNTWRSNFVNKILDDSIYIHELDQYGEGTWFYYSFNVHKNGAISDISVKSMYLRPEDKAKVAKLIKSYQYKGITIFPAGSKRQVAKVSAVMMLSNTSLKSTPNDFNDGERIKLKR